MIKYGEEVLGVVMRRVSRARAAVGSTRAGVASPDEQETILVSADALPGAAVPAGRGRRRPIFDRSRPVSSRLVAASSIVVAGVAAVALTAATLTITGIGDERNENSAAATTTACTPARLGYAPTLGGPTLKTFRHDNTDRSYLLMLPDGYDGRTAYPLVFNFHGFKASKELQERRTSMSDQGATRGFIVVTPDALGSPTRWNTPGDAGKADDVGFVHALVGELGARLCVDPSRVYATGHSNGSEFAAALACRSPYLFAAVGMVSSTFPAECPSGVTPAVIAIHGTADVAVPYYGGAVGGAAAPVPAARGVIEDYAERYGCEPALAREWVAPDVDRIRYSGCAGDADVVLLTVVGGTHPWPSSPDAVGDPVNSAAGRTFAATGAVLDFFGTHRTPG